MKALRLAAFALIAVAASATSMANNIDLGAVTVPGSSALGTATAAPGSFSDNFYFSFTAPNAFPDGVTFAFTSKATLIPTSASIGKWDTLTMTASPASETMALFPSPGTVYYFGFSQLTTPGDYYVNISGTNSGASAMYGVQVQLVPEPGTLALFGLGLAGAAFAARRGKAVRAA